MTTEFQRVTFYAEPEPCVVESGMSIVADPAETETGDQVVAVVVVVGAIRIDHHLTADAAEQLARALLLSVEVIREDVS